MQSDIENNETKRLLYLRGGYQVSPENTFILKINI